MLIESVRSRRFLLLIAAALVLHIAGCGQPAAAKRELAEVTGKITFKGKAVTTGKILFQPTTGEAASGDIAKDGTFHVKGVVGSNKVRITSREADTWVPKPDKPGTTSGPPPGYMPPKSLIPDIYAGPASPLVFDIKPGTNTKDFDLEDLKTHP